MPGACQLERFVDLTSAGAARIFSIAGKGRIARGFDADFTIVDLKAKKTIENSLDRVEMRLDAVRWHGDDRLGRGDDHSWADGDARPRADAAVEGPADPLRRNLAA